MDIPILYQDDDFLVLDKPAGITVNRSDTTKGEQTVQDFTESKVLRSGIDAESEFYKRGGIVHRLDKETSGILLVAKNPPAFENLQRQFKERNVKKEYIALAHGKIIPAEGEISVPVGRLSFNRKRFGVVAGGRESATKYTVLETKYDGKEPLSLVQLYPETGRTHQIRVHLKYINHPIFADPLYGGRKTARNDRKILSRVFLHAAKISFAHPSTGERVEFESKLPDELQNFLDSLQAG